MNKKVEDLVDYLDSMGMSQNSYLVMADWQELHHSYDMLSYCEKIYDLFKYAGLTTNQIEKFIVNSKSLFLMPFEEFVKAAYVLQRVNVNDELFDSNRGCARSKQYKKLYMRNILFEQVNRYEHGYGISGLISGEKAAYFKYGLGAASFKAFGRNISSDAELEEILNKHLTFNGEHVTVDEFLNLASKLFYSEYLRSKMKEKNKVK